MKNRKGFTLVELLITVTILGILLAIAIPTLTNINSKDISTQEKIYKESLLTSAKLYNDQFGEDLFGKKLNGCSKIPYSELIKRDLIKKLESKKLDCGYKVGDEDSSGIIVRKVNDNYYYEVILWCKNKETGKEISASNNLDDYFDEIDESYCNESASEDNDPPVLHYTNSNVRYFYNSSNLPNPKVWITDAVSGLKSPVSVSIEWTDPSGDSVSTTNTYRLGDGTNLPKKKIALPNTLIESNANGRYTLAVISNNIQDLVGNVLESGRYAVPETPEGSIKTVGNPEAFFIENSKPTIITTNNKTWTNQKIPVRLKANDDDGNTVYSGIKSFNYKVDNNSTETTINDGECGTVSNENDIIRNNPKNSIQEEKTCSFTIGEGQYGNGSYTVTTTAEDWAGNINTTINTYQYDKNLPTITITRVTYNKFRWIAEDTGYSELNGYVYNTSPTGPTSGWSTGQTSSGNRTISRAATYYTHVRDSAGNTNKASITAYSVTRSQGEGTTLTTKFESSGGTSFTNNPAALKGTPIYIEGALQDGYGNLVIKYGNSTITSGTTKTIDSNITISTSATKCPAGSWNDGTHAQCQSCPTGYISTTGAKSQSECYINVDAGKYKTTATNTATSTCGTGTFSIAHKSYYNRSDSCSQCPDGYKDGNGTTRQDNCQKKVSAGYYVKRENDTNATRCPAGSYGASHTVNYGNKSSCTSCPDGQTCPEGSTSSSACYSPCSSLSATWSWGNCNGCQKGGYYYYQYCKFSFSGCTDGLSGHMCYYNANGNNWCSVGKKYYANSGNTGYGYAEFSSTVWKYYRYTEGVEMNATNSNGNSVRKICN